PPCPAQRTQQATDGSPQIYRPGRWWRRRLRRPPPEHRGEGARQRFRGQPRRRAGRRGICRGQDRGAPEQAGVGRRQLLQARRGFLVTPVLGHPGQQGRFQGGLVLLGFVLLLLNRQEVAGLDPYQERRHHQVLAGFLELDGRQLAQELEVLLGHLGHGHLPDVHLLLLDEVQQEVQRAFEDRQAHLVHRDVSLPGSATLPPGTRAKGRG